MSYEGYNQHICKNGHYYTRDDIGCWEDEDPCDDAWHAKPCGERPVWSNAVDDTNCDSYGEIDMIPFLVSVRISEVCNLGHKHTVEDPRYRVPTDDETATARSYRPDCGGTPLVPLSR